MSRGLIVLACEEDLTVWVTALQIIWINDTIWRRIFPTESKCQNPFEKVYAILALFFLFSEMYWVTLFQI